MAILEKDRVGEEGKKMGKWLSPPPPTHIQTHPFPPSPGLQTHTQSKQERHTGASLWAQTQADSAPFKAGSTAATGRLRTGRRPPYCKENYGSGREWRVRDAERVRCAGVHCVHEGLTSHSQYRGSMKLFLQLCPVRKTYFFGTFK